MKTKRPSRIQRLKNLYDLNAQLKVQKSLGPDCELEAVRSALSLFDELLFPKAKALSAPKAPAKKKISEIRRKILEKKKSSLKALQKRVLTDFCRFLLNLPNEAIREKVFALLTGDFSRMLGEFLRSLLQDCVIEKFKAKLGRQCRCRAPEPREPFVCNRQRT